MPVSYAAVSTNQMELTPMRVTFKGVDLGGTLGNVKINWKYEKANIMADQLGTTVLDRRNKGLNITVTTELTEIQFKDNWKIVFPNLQFISSGSKAGHFVSDVGKSDVSLAGILLLHPLSKVDADLTEDFLAYLACSDASSEITYGPGEQAKLKIVWNIYPDTSVIPAKFMHFGDPSVGTVAASAAAAVAGSNTGNGTVSSPVAYSGFTKTETITMLVVGVPSANNANWEVTGSLSGPLGLAKNGIAFVSPVVSFTISDGTTDFIIGDSFTIATTAANYV